MYREHRPVLWPDTGRLPRLTRASSPNVPLARRPVKANAELRTVNWSNQLTWRVMPATLLAMVYQPVTRVPVADQVFGQLRDQILTGALAPDDPLPAERELAVRFGVNRHAIREAVKRLQQARLVRVSQGGLSRVLDWRHSAGLDLMVAIRDSGEQLPIDSLARDLAEMRACVGADAARLCAQRASPAVRDAVLRAADGFADSTDLDALAEADLAFWRAVIVGSGNLAYLLSFNSLVDCGLAVPPMPAGRRAAELLDVAAHRALARHIAAGDAAAAEQVARTLLSPTSAVPRPARRSPRSRRS